MEVPLGVPLDHGAPTPEQQQQQQPAAAHAGPGRQQDVLSARQVVFGAGPTPGCALAVVGWDPVHTPAIPGGLVSLACLRWWLT